MTQKTYGLIGKTLKHSFSKSYFSEKFEKMNISAEYLNFEVDNKDGLKAILSSEHVQGYNVTIPYKQEVIPFLDELDESAKAVGAVNTIKRIDNKLLGFNTDVYGFKQMIKPFFKSHHERAIILGTGGASKAVEYVLKDLGCSPIFISRNPEGTNQFHYSDINDIMLQSCPVIVNTTPVGMYPHVEGVVNIPYQALNDKNLVIDLIYNPLETEFLKKAKAQGAWTLNGLTMLHQQAEKAWEIWNS